MRRINYKQTAPNRMKYFLIKSKLQFQKVPLAAPLLHISKNHRKVVSHPGIPTLCQLNGVLVRMQLDAAGYPCPGTGFRSSCDQPYLVWRDSCFCVPCECPRSSIHSLFQIVDKASIWDKALGGALRTQEWMRSILALPTPIAKSRVPNSTECNARGPVPGCGCLWELVWG